MRLVYLTGPHGWLKVEAEQRWDMETLTCSVLAYELLTLRDRPVDPDALVEDVEFLRSKLVAADVEAES
jgi:hypothetical protein